MTTCDAGAARKSLFLFGISLLKLFWERRSAVKSNSFVGIAQMHAKSLSWSFADPERNEFSGDDLTDAIRN